MVDTVRINKIGGLRPCGTSCAAVRRSDPTVAAVLAVVLIVLVGTGNVEVVLELLRLLGLIIS